VDVLTDVLERSRARGAAFSHATAFGRWALRFPTRAGLGVHVVGAGQLDLAVEGEAPVRLVAGDLALVKGDREHLLGTDLSATATPLLELLATGRVEGAARSYTLGTDDGAGPTVFFCGAYSFDGDLSAALVDALPSVARIRAPAGSALRATADLLAGEVLRDDIGQQTILDRLLDVALVQAVRAHFVAAGPGAPGWARASADPAVGAALRAMHADPAHPWTVGELAAVAMLSRSAFARRFTELLGRAPLAYLADWRMALARERLRDTDDGLAAVARAVGYASEFAFAAAFKRHVGAPPGQWRRQARGDTAA
jgi:AraC-like DNA-binding protein